MIEQLKSLYGQAFIGEIGETQDPDAYYWFKTETGVPFGLRKSAVTDKEYQLLSISLHPVISAPKLFTEEERKWSSYLFDGKTGNLILSPEDKRCILHIYFKVPFKEDDAFREAVLALFDEAPVILWKNNHTAILILKSRPDLTKAEEIAQLLASDFYSDVHLFVGSSLSDSNLVKPMFEMEEMAFELARKSFPEKRSFIFEKVIPLLLLSLTSHEVLSTSFSSLLSALKDEDPEWITSILAFFEHGMNITATSKALFIHRNSLQYRLERFIEKTGLDPRQFDDALFIHLALLTQKLK
jgi:sugar diacid utilization regulator